MFFVKLEFLLSPNAIASNLKRFRAKNFQIPKHDWILMFTDWIALDEVNPDQVFVD